MKLNLGCGDKVKKSWINADISKECGADTIIDANKIPYKFKESSFSYILMDNLLEHLDVDLNKLKDELFRISKNRTKIEIIVPDVRNFGGAFGDYTHKRFFDKDALIHLFGGRGLMHYDADKRFRIISIEKRPGIYKKYIPMFILKILDKFLHSVFIDIRLIVEVQK